jgi:hypothetical protein
VIVFKPWREFLAVFDKRVVNDFLRAVARDSEKAFKDGIRSPKSGRMYRRSGGGSHRASAPGEYPARDTGALEASIGTTVSTWSVTIGTRRFYSRFLRDGTRKMARRKMSDSALTEGVKTARHRLKGFAKWKRT